LSTQQGSEQQFPAFTLGDPIASPVPLPYPVPTPDEKWTLPYGFAWVYYGQGHRAVRNPVIMADGFNLGKSDLNWLYAGLDRDYPFIANIRERGRSVILLGFDERTASILDNAKTAEAAVRRAAAERQGSAPLVVGGFSMGGLITRYALARLEAERSEASAAVGLYFSYDTPHRGGVVPVGLQAFAHFIPTLPGQEHPFAKQMNSPAGRQMLWRHYDNATGQSRIDPLREAFLTELGRVGGWPALPRKIAVANGTGTGTGLPIPPGDLALKSTGQIGFPGTSFYTQAAGRDVTVAELKRTLPAASKTVKTSGFPELDGAPGGTLDSYRLVADAIKASGGTVDLRHPSICFVPSVSAVAIRDIDDQNDLYAKIDLLNPQESELDEFRCSSRTSAHTEITEELCAWILEQLPEGR